MAGHQKKETLMTLKKKKTSDIISAVGFIAISVITFILTVFYLIMVIISEIAPFLIIPLATVIESIAILVMTIIYLCEQDLLKYNVKMYLMSRWLKQAQKIHLAIYLLLAVFEGYEDYYSYNFADRILYVLGDTGFMLILIAFNLIILHLVRKNALRRSIRIMSANAQ